MKQLLIILFITVIAVICCGSCVSTRERSCPSNDKNWFYRHEGAKKFKAKNTLACWIPNSKSKYKY